MLENTQKDTQDTSPTNEEALDSIRKERHRLHQEQHELYTRQIALNQAHYALQHKLEALYARCTHPNDQKKRTGGVYSETEWHCPDCGRIC